MGERDWPIANHVPRSWRDAFGIENVIDPRHQPVVETPLHLEDPARDAEQQREDAELYLHVMPEAACHDNPRDKNGQQNEQQAKERLEQDYREKHRLAEYVCGVEPFEDELGGRYRSLLDGRIDNFFRNRIALAIEPMSRRKDENDAGKPEGNSGRDDSAPGSEQPCGGGYDHQGTEPDDLPLSATHYIRHSRGAQPED